MYNNKWIRWTGWGMVLAAILLLLTFLSLPFAFLGAITLITSGLGGLYVRYGQNAGILSPIALIIGIIGGLSGVISNLFIIIGYTNDRSWMNLSITIMFIGLFLFGLVTLRQKPMPQGNGLPILAGFWFPLIFVGANIYHQITGSWLNVPFWLSFTLFCAMSIPLAALGYLLQADASHSQTNSPF